MVPKQRLRRGGHAHSGEFPDGGWGYFKPGEELPYAFIAYYASWYYTSHHVKRIRDLANAYARTGDRRPAKAATLMMFRSAEQYLNLAVNINMHKSLTRSSVWAGRIVPQTEVSICNTWLYIEHNWEVPRHSLMCAAFEQPSSVCDGYGHAILRAGEGDDRRALWVRYGRARGHAHNDMPAIGFEGRQRKLLPEIGYPHSWTYRSVCEGHWAAHYCTRVEGSMARSRGHCTLMADGPWARVTVACSPGHYDVDPAERYQMVPDTHPERTLALIDTDEQNSYAVDLSTVTGGTSHWWSFHGPRSEGEAAIDGLAPEKQDGGTLAGPQIQDGEGGEWLGEHKDLAAFTYLYDVARARTSAPWAIDWPLEGYPDVHVRMSYLPLVDAEVGLAKGKPPGGGDPYELDWVLTHTEGAEPHRAAARWLKSLVAAPRVEGGAWGPPTRGGLPVASQYRPCHVAGRLHACGTPLWHVKPRVVVRLVKADGPQEAESQDSGRQGHYHDQLASCAWQLVVRAGGVGLNRELRTQGCPHEPARGEREPCQRAGPGAPRTTR